jgi:hypothetical protein
MRNHRARLAVIFWALAVAQAVPAFCQIPQGVAAGGYGDTLYPYVHEYDQMLVYKIGVDYCPASKVAPLNAGQALDVIRRVDQITRGIPKLVYLVGWQYRGHDTGYPSLAKVNDRLKRSEDATALDSLRWLMREGPKYHTLVSLHVNFSDCYLDDNPLGPLYKERNIIVRNTDGTYHQGYVWCDHMAYRASSFRNWTQDTFKDEQIDPLFKMLPELARSGSLHVDAWYSTDDPYYGITDVQDCRAMREMTVYVRRTYGVDLTTEFDRRRPPGIDFVLFHPLLWHLGWDERTPPDPMKIPSYLLTGGNALTWSNEAETVQSKFFGDSCLLEDEINRDPTTIPGGIRAFATHTLPWYFLNRKLRMSFDGNTATFTDGVTTSFPGKHVIKSKESFLQDGNDVFIPALWRANQEVMAYSADGYSNRSWKLPQDWAGIQKVDMYRITPDGLIPKQKGLEVSPQGTVTMTLAPDEGVSIVPAGVDPTVDLGPSESGTVTFVGVDDTTKGAWKHHYGSDGYVVIGASRNLPSYLQMNYINGAEHVWVPKTTDVQALEEPTGDGRVAAQRASGLHEIIDLNITDGNPHDVALYVVDWDWAGRWAAVDVIDPGTRKLLDSRNVTSFGSGRYLKYHISGHVQFRITNVWTKRYTASPDAGFSGVFFDPIGTARTEP